MMNNNERQKTVRQVLNDRLTPEETSKILEQKPLFEYMYQQWNLCETDKIPHSESVRIHLLNRIQDRIASRERKHISYYTIASVACILLLLVMLSVSVYHNIQRSSPQTQYVVTTGIQNMRIINLPDGSSVHLGPGTKLTYPESFNGRLREVTLDGLAFFDVTQSHAQPFIVHTSHVDIHVLGTSFEVFSYSAEDKIEAVLLKGSIKAISYNKSNDVVKNVTLKPNQKIMFDKELQTMTMSSVDACKYTAWSKSGVLSFENESLTMILPRLEQWYGRKIYCRKDIAENYRFTFKVRDESLERILFILGKSSPIKYEKVNEENYELVLKN